MTSLNINPNIITWAINRAGLELESLIAKSPNIKKWIDQEKKPTVKQLEKLSQITHIPFGYFFLQETPTIEMPIPFFRTTDDLSSQFSLELIDTISIITQRQEWLKDYLQSIDAEKLPYVGKYKNKSVYDIVQSIRNTLNLPENWALDYPNWESALDGLTKKVEDAGVIVVFNGVVGNNTHRTLKVEECRGFVVVDDMAPFMFINNADSKSAQMFTIAHELAHIWIGSTAGFDFRELTPSNDENEMLCDKVAAELLVPESLFITHWRRTQSIQEISKYFKVSELVIARRALDTDMISKKEFFDYYNEYIQHDISKKSKRAGGGDFYLTVRKRVSLKFASYVNLAVKSGDILHRDAYKLTGLSGDTFYKFISDNFGIL